MTDAPADEPAEGDSTEAPAPEESAAEAAAPTPPTRRRRWLRLGAALASFGVALLIGELAVRLISPQRLTVPTQEAVWGLIVPRAGVSGRDVSPGEFDVQVTTTAARFRGTRAVSPTPAPGTQRIAVLGDSFTFGEGADDAATIPAVLERTLRASGAQVEVLNAGNRGSGLGEQALYYQEHVRRFGARVVLVIAYANDVGDDLSRGLFVKRGDAVTPRDRAEREAADADLRSVRSVRDWIPGYTWLTQRSHGVNLLRRVGTGILTGRRTEAEGNVPAADAAERFTTLGLPLLRGELRWLHDQVTAEGAALAVVFLPTREVARGEAPELERAQSAAQVTALATTCAELSVPFEDLTALMTQEAARTPKTIYYDWDPHLRPAGYAVVARQLAAFLRRVKLVPE